MVVSPLSYISAVLISDGISIGSQENASPGLVMMW
jgi:hypothetical protein